MVTPDAASAVAAPPRVRKLRHTGQTIAAVVLCIPVLALAVSVVANENFRWPVFADYLTLSTILGGLGMTLQLTVVSMLIAIVLGVGLALMQLSNNRLLQAYSAAYVWFFRGVPLLVLILFTFNLSALYPNVTWFGTTVDVNALLTPFLVSVLAFSLHEAAYMSEIIRSGILAVDRGQIEAAAALGLSPARTFQRITLPQAMRVILPPTGNQVIGLLKGTSMVSVIAVPDLLYSVQAIYTRNFETIPLLLVAVFWYLLVTTALTFGQRAIERKFGRGFARSTTSKDADND